MFKLEINEINTIQDFYNETQKVLNDLKVTFFSLRVGSTINKTGCSYSVSYYDTEDENESVWGHGKNPTLAILDLTRQIYKESSENVVDFIINGI